MKLTGKALDPDQSVFILSMGWFSQIKARILHLLSICPIF